MLDLEEARNILITYNIWAAKGSTNPHLKRILEKYNCEDTIINATSFLAHDVSVLCRLWHILYT